MRHRRRLSAVAIAGALLAVAAMTGPASAAPAGTARPAHLGSGQACGGTGTTSTVTGALSDGATYELQCPAGRWNGTLFLFSHGYVVPGGANPAADASDPVTAGWLLANGYALAGSSYASTGWSVQQAIPDQAATVAAFGRAYQAPRRTVAWGESLGGMITAGLIQEYPRLFSAALPACGVLSGGVATWNTALDAAFAFQQLVDPDVQVTGITSPAANLTAAETALAAAQQTPQGRARMALVSAMSDTPGWFTPGSPEPAATDYTAQEDNQFQWASQVTFPFVFDFRAELEARAGGNPSWTTGVNFAAELASSTDLREVEALYQAAGLSLNADLRTLSQAPRISANPKSVRYLADNVAYTGRISVPVLTIHTTGDGLVVPENEQAYRQAVDRAGDGSLLRQLFVSRAGHCAFTPAEMITAIKVLVDRMSSGRWHVPPVAQLNAAAAALGTAANTLPPQYTTYQPAPYLRPFDLAGWRW
ncbi:MAG TPA: prolyl oligopeptidase family serine peptidase [Trebonia sp.]|nr:prolyl oligopeptidase family serine peptidase [Trebonia sp.]